MLRVLPVRLVVYTSLYLVCAQPPPNIFMVLIDDLGYHNVGFHNPDQVSPNIDNLVKEGIQLEAHYTFQYCSPTRSSFLSGRLPIHVNMEQPSPGRSPGGIDLRMTLISNVSDWAQSVRAIEALFLACILYLCMPHQTHTHPL